MKEKLLAQLVLKYPGVSKKFLGLLAEKQSTKVTDETQIEGVINELDNLPISVTDLAAEWQKEGDARVNAAKQEWLKTPPKPDKPEKTDPPTPTPQPPTDEPAWFKAYREKQESESAEMRNKLAGIEKEKAIGSIKQQLSTKLKDVPASIWSKRVLPETEDAIEAFVTEVKADYQADFVEKGLLNMTSGGGNGHATGSGKVDPAVIAFAKAKNEEAIKKQ